MNEITTEKLIEIFKVIENYLKNAYGVDLVEMIENVKKNNEDFMEVLHFVFFTEPRNNDLKSIYNYMHQEIENLNISEPYQFLFSALYEMYEKGLVRIEKEIIKMSDLQPDKVTQNKNGNVIEFKYNGSNVDRSDDHFSLSEEDLKKLVDTLKANVNKYLQLYNDKIWLIESEAIDGTELLLPKGFKRREKICITPERFFHLMGLDFKAIDIRNTSGSSQRIAYNELLSLCGNNTIVDNLINKYLDEERRVKSDEKSFWLPSKGLDLFNLLQEMLKNETKLINYLGDGKLSHLISIPKLYMKAYSFERLGFIEHSNGMVLFDKKVAMKNSVRADHLGSGIILLKDFILRNKLDFIISLYNQTSSLDTEKIPRNQQTIFISEKGGFNSGIFTGQLSSISSQVSSFKAKDFMYTIKCEGIDGTSLSNYFNTHEPLSSIEFSNEEKQRMAELMVHMFPQMNHVLLEEFIKNNQDSLNGTKKQ